ncbi:NAD(P)H azoreductase [Sphingobacterium spiritivorum]|uniref:NAD(P)H azoreductase n=1 Tax=Sphingobacterium spiritivorum TaxID=258 RepID=A0A380CQ93_SPHSI|nr:NmrA family NAD(P)-binding protein [Sphingobacterium spiritivorum]SUJ24279.1 NAD(P)H azoreductase [Sphingobacterium spiritivorum]
MKVTKNNKKILVIGGSGKNGSRVVRKLRELNYPAFSTVRKGNIHQPNVRIFEWKDTSTWEAALTDIDSIYIVHPDTSMPEAYTEIKELAEKSVKMGITRLVLLSGRGQQSVIKCEDAIRKSGLEWTIVRSAWFNQNFTEGHFAASIQHGELIFLADTVKEPFVDLEDLTDVIVQCLIDDKHNHHIYEVTGPALHSFEEAVQIIGATTGKPVRYIHADADNYYELLVQHGLSQDLATHMIGAFEEILDGRNANIGDGIEKVLGRPPVLFTTFVKNNFQAAEE